MLMLLGTILMGLIIGGVGYVMAPERVRPPLWHAVVAGALGALPGATMAALLSQDFWLGLDGSAAAVSIVGSLFAVMTVAFAGEAHPAKVMPARTDRT
jgi:uncharacterized membrane protein YeaQ/YmgE (transglycosylase-associated protein family)